MIFPSISQLLSREKVSSLVQIKELDIVALTENITAKQFETGEPLHLQQGQVGTVVIELGDNYFEVEFADRDGIPYAIEALTNRQLLVLHHQPIPAIAV